MQDVATLINELRSVARALEVLTETPPQTPEARQQTAAVIADARAALRGLANIGAEPEDFDRDTPLWRQARLVTEGRRILANALSIAAQSMFTAADPVAVRRDLQRAVGGLLHHANIEQELLAGGAAQREVA